jgi:glycosyltransferase involved in cell wall biosynthesis
MSYTKANMEKVAQNKAKIKVLFLITKSNFGGAQRYVYDLATNLDRTKFEPVVALGGSGALLTMLQNANIPTITLQEMQNSTSLKQAWRSYQELLGILKSEKPDVLHLNSSIAGLVGAVAGRFARVPNIIFTAHGWAFNEDRPLWQRIAIKFFHYITVLLSLRTIAVSNAIVSQMNWPGAQRKMKVINPGRTIGAMYDRNEARTKLIDIYPQLAASVSAYWVTCVAELHPVKRHTVLIDAFAKRLQAEPNQILVLIGEGKMHATLETLIKGRGLTNKIFLLGNVVDAARFLKAFDVFVLVSKSESYGYVLHEAGLAGVPIVATNVGGIPDIITHPYDGILIPPGTSDNLVSALTEIYQNKALAMERAHTLQTKLEARTVTKMTRQTESIYQVK